MVSFYTEIYVFNANDFFQAKFFHLNFLSQIANFVNVFSVCPMVHLN